MRSQNVLISDLRDQDVGILGAGREGLVAWQRLRAQSPRQPLTLYSEGGFPADVPFSDLDRLISGPLDGKLLAQHDVLIRSPGISPYRDALQEALKAGTELTTGTNLWMAENPDARTLCVSGTKGKSTTSALLAHLLQAAGARVGLAGNIGKPLLACDPKEADWWVLELSSYQICDLHQTPWASVLLNLSDEHLDWHGGPKRYRQDKLRLLELAPAGRRLANWADESLRETLNEQKGIQWFNQPSGLHRNGGKLWEGANALPAMTWLPGDHNLDNLAAALAVADLIDLRPADLAGALTSFRGLPHRLAFLGNCGGIEFVNDSLSTTPVATLAALRALAPSPTTVILGGLDRGLDWSVHAAAFGEVLPHAILGLPDNGKRVLSALEKAGLNPVAGFHQVSDMESAVKTALELTPDGGVVLLSPGAPSFPHYRDFAERGDAFKAAADLACNSHFGKTLSADSRSGQSRKPAT